MPIPTVATADAEIDFAHIRDEMGIVADFSPEVLAEAAAAAQAVADGRDPLAATRGDDREIPLVTIDPEGSQDLDQAVHIAEVDGGYRVHYAIADVAAFVHPGGPLDQESRRRGMTLYCPDERVLLYPAVLSEGAASLLPGADRPAVLWTIDLDDAGEPVAVDVRRSLVRSREKYDYQQVQAQANVGELHSSIAMLPRVGRLRLQLARRRHAINLDLPSAEVVRGDDEKWTLQRRSMLPVERYNAEISLLTGMCAAQLMLDGRVGILRTLPPPDATQVEQLRHATAVLGIDWPQGMPPGDVVSDLDSALPRQAAFIEDAIRLLRGADYTAFDGAIPKQTMHGGLGTPYTHVTAPMRRLVDRFATEVCLSLCAAEPIPEWALTALPELPGLMSAATNISRELERTSVQAVSEFLLADRVGEVLTGVVVQRDVERNRTTILLDEPPVRVRATADGFVEGSRAAVRLISVDQKKHRVDVDIVQ